MNYLEESVKCFILKHKVAQDCASNNLKKFILAATLTVIKDSWLYKKQGKKLRFSSNPKLDKKVNDTLKNMKTIFAYALHKHSK